MMSSLESTMWIRSPLPLPNAHYRLFCLPYAGDDATLFGDWPDLLPAHMRNRVEICTINLPGCLHRFYERPLFTSITDLVNVLVPQRLNDSVLYPYLDKPFALFGVSLGGLIMFEVARALALCYHLSPLSLCVAACRAPHLSSSYPLESDNHLLSSDGGRESYNIGNSHLKKSYADTLLSNTYLYIPGLVLNCPITLWGGIQDKLVSPSDLGLWQAHTSNRLNLHWLPGSHFFVRDARVQVRTRLLYHLSQIFEPTPGGIPFYPPLVQAHTSFYSDP